MFRKCSFIYRLVLRPGLIAVVVAVVDHVVVAAVVDHVVVVVVAAVVRVMKVLVP